MKMTRIGFKEMGRGQKFPLFKKMNQKPRSQDCKGGSDSASDEQPSGALPRRIHFQVLIFCYPGSLLFT